MQLQHWVHNSKHSLQDSLVVNIRNCASLTHNIIHRAFVLNHHPDTMGSALGQLLHDFGKVDSREKVAPRVLSEFFHCFFVFPSVGKCCSLNFCVPCWPRYVILWTYRLRVLGKIDKAVPEKAMGDINIEEGNQGHQATYLFSGESALDTTAKETSCKPNIFKINNRQFVSSRCCPR